MTDAGSYTLTATNSLDGYNVAGNALSANSLPVSATSSAATLTVSTSAATVALSNLTQTYTGLPLSATVTTSPVGAAVAVTYNGSSTAPTAVGTYAVVATINDPNFTGGSATGTLTITPATPVPRLDCPGRDLVRDAPGRRPARRDGERPRHLCLQSRCWDGPAAGRQPGAQRHLHLRGRA